MSGNGEFAGKVVLVTGASRGIGAETARRFAAEGATLVLASRGREALEAVAAEIEAAGGSAMAVPTDMTEPEAIDALVSAVDERHGRLDVLVSNAGVLPEARRIERYSREEWNAVIDTNLAGPWQLSCGAKALMHDGGVVIHIASTAALYPSIGLGVYCVSKAALVMLTRAQALEWASKGIRVVGILPGKTQTEMVEPILDFIEAKGLELNPLQRVGEPGEIADAILYAASPRASFMTGTMITLDGGESISTP